MSPLFFDRVTGSTVLVQSRAQRRMSALAAELRQRGYDLLSLHCACCGKRLRDLHNVSLRTEGPLGPECSKPGHNMACRNREALEVPAA